MRLRSALLSTALVAATVVVSTGTAHATDHDGVCDPGEMCLYWDSNLGGSLYDTYWSVADFGDARFISPGAGQGQLVKNNTASATNRHTGDARVFYNESYTGASDVVPAFSSRNLVNTWNDNASICWC